MEIPRELLALSRRIAEAAGAGEASLRRAVSTAYYAVFHLLTTNAAKQLAPTKPENVWFRLSRMFDHAVVNDVCKSFSSEKIQDASEGLLTGVVEPELIDLARHFSSLREARMIADYDLSFRPNFAWAEEAITKAERAFSNWDLVKDTPNAVVFMTALAVPKVLARRR